MSRQNFAICGFPGVGKSAAARHNREVIDLESTPYRWVFDPNEPSDSMKPNPLWPQNYADAIEAALEDPHNIVLISTHKEIRDELLYRGIPYAIVMPAGMDNAEDKRIYMNRYFKRGSSYKFLAKMGRDYYGMKKSLQDDAKTNNLPIFLLDKDQHIEDILPLGRD